MRTNLGDNDAISPSGDRANNPDTDRPDRAALAPAGQDAMTADFLEGARVYGANERWVGEVSGLVLGDTGEVTGIIVDVGGWLGLAERPVALSLDSVDLRRGDADDRVIVFVDATQEELEALPR